jgi:hypothetical protein
VKAEDGLMPAAVKVIHARDFVRAEADGTLLLEDSLRMLGEIAAAAADLREHDVIIDVRQADSRLSAADLWTLAQRLAGHRHLQLRKTAVLCPQERFDKARFFAMCAEYRGFCIRAFTDYESAMEWIIFDRDES